MLVASMPRIFWSARAKLRLIDLVITTSTAPGVYTLGPDVGGELTVTETLPTPFLKPLRWAS